RSDGIAIGIRPIHKLSPERYRDHVAGHTGRNGVAVWQSNKCTDEVYIIGLAGVALLGTGTRQIAFIGPRIRVSIHDGTGRAGIALAVKQTGGGIEDT